MASCCEEVSPSLGGFYSAQLILVGGLLPDAAPHLAQGRARGFWGQDFESLPLCGSSVVAMLFLLPWLVCLPAWIGSSAPAGSAGGCSFGEMLFNSIWILTITLSLPHVHAPQGPVQL